MSAVDRRRQSQAFMIMRNGRVLKWFVVAAALCFVGAGAVAYEHTVMEDTFGDGFTLWGNYSPTWEVTGDGLHVSGNYVASLTGGHHEWDDVQFDAEVRLNGPLGPRSSLRFLIRWQDNWQGYGVIFGSSGARLVLFSGGESQYQVLAQSDIVLQPGETYRIGIRAQGRRLTVYVNEQIILQGMDPVQIHPRGYIGIYSERTDVLLQRVTVTGANDTLTIDREWMAEQSDFDRYMATFPAANFQGAGFAPPGIVNNMVLIYTHSMDWQLTEALPYVGYAHFLREPRKLPRFEWHDWMFDSFLFLSLLTDDKARAYDSANRATPATWHDWQAFLDRLFKTDAQFAGFDQAVAHIKPELNDDDHRAKVAVMIPYPTPEQGNFGDIDGSGKSLSFRPQGSTQQSEQAAYNARLAAVNAYVDEFMERWRQTNYEHLELIGFYWLAENVGGAPYEKELVRAVAQKVHELDLGFYWIPYYSATGYRDWAELGFDTAIYQPNYMFNASIPRSRFKDAAEQAYRYGLGVEIEADSTVLTSEEGRQRYLDYLWAGVRYGYMEDAVKAYYQGSDVLGKAFLSTDAAVRDVYDTTYLFLKSQLGKEEGAE